MPGPQSQHSPEEWQRARDLVASGIPMPEVAERTGISYENLKKKAQREEWLVPNSAISKAKILGATEARAENCPAIVPAEAILAESVAEMGQKGQIHALRGMMKRFLSTFSEDSALMQKEVEDWKTAGSMVNIFSKLSGLDKPQIAIQTNVWGDGWGAQGAVPVESSEVESDDAS